MKRVIGCAVLLLIIGWLAFTWADQVLRVSYRWSGGLSPYTKVAVDISTTGEAEVSILWQNRDSIRYRTTLSKQEMTTLKMVIADAEFFSLENKVSLHATCTGETHITVTRRRGAKTLTFRRIPNLDLLCHHFGLLINQATAIHAIESDGDIYSATSGIKAGHSAPSPLQPERLKGPLIQYVGKAKDRQKIEWALEGLAAVTTPEEFASLVAGEIKKNNRESLMLSALPRNGNYPEAHRKALLPFFLAYVQEHYERQSNLSPEQKYALERFVGEFGNSRYEPAIPLLVQWFEKCEQPTVATNICPLGMMGNRTIEVMLPYLASANALRRRHAMELLQIAARGNPKGVHANPYPQDEYRRMVVSFKDQVLPRLKEIAADDGSADVREQAARAIEEITLEISR